MKMVWHKLEYDAEGQRDFTCYTGVGAGEIDVVASLTIRSVR